MKPFYARLNAILAAVTITLSVLWLAVGAAVGGQADPARGEAGERRPQGVVADQYIVVFHDDVANPRDSANALGQRHGFTPHRTYQYALKGFAARMPASVARALALDPDVALVEPDVYAHTTAQVIPTGVARIGANPATVVGCDSVNIAVIDTGIDLDHPDLNVNLAKSKSFLGDNTGSPDDDNGHGTHVAGIIAAKNDNNGVVGVCPGALLWAIKVLDSTGSGYFSDIIEGVDYVTANANLVKVVNMSLGGIGYLASFRTAIQYSVAAGVVYVVAAGNNAMDVYGANSRLDTASDYNAFLCAFFGLSCGDDFIPAAYPEVATISAMADNDGQPRGLCGPTYYGNDDSFATFSNFSKFVDPSNPVVSEGRAIDLLMPGVNIYSTWKNGGYATLSGTSMASPHAAGLAARYIVDHPRPDNAGGQWVQWVYDVRQALINNGIAQDDSMYGLNPPLNDPDVYREKIGWVSAPLPAQQSCLSISINDVTLTEGNAGTRTAEFTVSLSQAPSTLPIMVNFNTANGTATAGSDYVATSGTLSFAAGELTKSITVVVNGDTTAEPDETFFVNLSGNSSHSQILDGQGVGTITNDDTASSVEVFIASFEAPDPWSGWTKDSQWKQSSQRKTIGTYSADVAGSATDAKLTSNAIGLSGKTNATITFSWYIQNTIDTGEYLAFDVSTNNGTTWSQMAILRGNVDPENQWRNATVNVNGITTNSLRLQFRGRMNRTDEHANVDNIKVVAN